MPQGDPTPELKIPLQMHTLSFFSIVIYFLVHVALASDDILVEPRLELQRVIFPFQGSREFPEIKFKHRPNDKCCIQVYNCPQSIRLDWRPTGIASRVKESNDCTGPCTLRAVTTLRSQNTKSGGHVLSRYLSADYSYLNMTYIWDPLIRMDCTDINPFTLYPYQWFLNGTVMFDRLIDLAIVYHNGSSYSCNQHLPMPDACGDLSVSQVTLKLHWKSNFDADPSSFALPDPMLDILDVRFEYNFLQTPEQFKDAEIYVVLGMTKSFVDRQWSILQRQWLNQTFYEFARFGRNVQVRVLDMQLGYQLPPLPSNAEEKQSGALLLYVGITVLALLFLCIGATVWLKQRRMSRGKNSNGNADETSSLLSQKEDIGSLTLSTPAE